MKIYLKRGNTNYKEKKLIAKIQDAIEKRIEQDSNFAKDFKPATNFGELQELYKKYGGDEVAFEEVSNSTSSVEGEHKSFRDNLQPKKEVFNDDYDFVDPLNREEPIVRDYVTHEEFPDEAKGQSQQAAQVDFAEPISFKESFELPGQEQEGQPQPKVAGAQGGNTQPKQTKPKQAPLNPDFDDMSGGKKKKSTRKFAKYIVEAVAVLSEQGFVWFANKDINDAKLAEYELNQEMDLTLLVTLEDGQEATVKQFFQVQCAKAQHLSKISEEEKQDIADALAMVLEEKGVAPTPTQELMLVGLSIIGRQAITLFALKTQTNSLLNQLRAMNEDRQPTRQQRPAPQPTPQPTPEPKQQPKQQAKEEPMVLQDVEEGNFDSLNNVIIDKPIQTLE